MAPMHGLLSQLPYHAMNDRLLGRKKRADLAFQIIELPHKESRPEWQRSVDSQISQAGLGVRKE